MITITIFGFDNSNMSINAQVKAIFIVNILIYYWKWQEAIKIIKQNILYLNVSSTNQMISILIELRVNKPGNRNTIPNLIKSIIYRKQRLNKKL